jgi:hypothetical protein
LNRNGFKSILRVEGVDRSSEVRHWCGLDFNHRGLCRRMTLRRVETQHAWFGVILRIRGRYVGLFLDITPTVPIVSGATAEHQAFTRIRESKVSAVLFVRRA